MTAEQIEQSILIQLQANGTTDKIQTSRSRIAVTYNRVQNQIVEFLIDKSDDDNRYLQKIKVLNKKLTKDTTGDKLDSFNNPSDYFDFINIEAFASKDTCKNQRLNLDEIKGGNKNSLLTDEFSKPSFKFRESLYIIAEDKVNIYKEDFTIDKVYMDYYRYPKQMTLQNPSNPESSFTTGEMEFDDKLTNKIITLTSSALMLNGNDPKYQALKQEIFQKI